MVGLWRLLMMTLCCLLFAVAKVDSQELKARAQFVNQQEPVVGQKVVLQVDLLTTSWFASAPVLPNLQWPNTVVIQPSGFAINFNETIKGVAYTGQRREYLIYPQQAGDISAKDIVLLVTIAGEDGKPMAAQEVTVAIDSLSVKSIAGSSDGARGDLVATKVSLQERYSVSGSRDSSNNGKEQGDTLQITAGNAIERIITITAEDTLSMLIPPLTLEAVSGLRLYRHQPELKDAANRGESRATRTERVSYYFESSGSKTLPEVSLRWWHPEQQRWITETLASLNIDVKAAPVSFSASSLRSPALWFGALLGVVVIGLIFMLWRSSVLHRGFSRLNHYRQQRLLQYRNSEPYLFKQLVITAKQAGPRLFSRRLYQWLDRWQQRDVHGRSHQTRALARLITLRGFAGDDKVTLNKVESFQRMACIGSPDPQAAAQSIDDIVPALKQRRAIMRRVNNKAKQGQLLPALNPDQHQH